MRFDKFFSEKKYVELAYLFGSFAEGRFSKLSDIDIGIYLSDDLSKKQRNRKHLKLIAELTSFLKNDKIDLVIMNDASLAINFEIIKANRPVFVRERDLKLEVEQRIMSRYLDREFHERRLNAAFLKRAATRGLA
ncbi:MAG: nucleotidyltransferase domain-containing protein [Candidatus Hydrothermarchaeales archaeon]